MRNKVLLFGIGGLVLLLGAVLLLVMTHRLLTPQQRAMRTEYRRHMNDPRYLAGQSGKTPLSAPGH